MIVRSWAIASIFSSVVRWRLLVVCPKVCRVRCVWWYKFILFTRSFEHTFNPLGAADDNKAPDAPPRPQYEDSQLEDIVDSVLRMMDLNSDGYIDYKEYRLSGVEANRRDDFPNGP